MGDQDQPTIIIIKKKKGHGGHHGGAWKVAYADFVTAMMALFIVLWLLSTSEETQKAIGAYFRDPTGTGKEQGSSMSGSGQGVSVSKDDMPQLKDKLERALKASPNMEQLKDYVQMSVTGDGLRVEMLENETGIFFDSGSPAPSTFGEEILGLLAQQLGQLPNDVLIEGHTDSRPFHGRDAYSNWELSVDRANAARRLMETKGLRLGQVTQVRGFADRDLRDSSHPEAASNRRISVIVRYQNPPPAEPGKAGEQAKPVEPAKPVEKAAEQPAPKQAPAAEHH